VSLVKPGSRLGLDDFMYVEVGYQTEAAGHRPVNRGVPPAIQVSGWSKRPEFIVRFALDRWPRFRLLPEGQTQS
jgi:hypothetical protein